MGLYDNIIPQLGQYAQKVDPNAQVQKPVVPPVDLQQPVADQPVAATPANMFKQNFFRATPTQAQANVVGASTVTPEQRAAEINQLKVDAAKREAAQQPVVQQQTKPYTGGPDNPEAAVDYLQAMYTSPQREEELRKASVQQQRIMAVANALRHIGNIYYTSKGATPQQFNDPVSEERTRYLKEKAIRDQNNYRYMTYQQAKAAQEQKAKQWEADYKLKVADAARKAGYTEAQIKALQDRIANDKSYKEGQLLIAKQKADDAKALGEAKLKETSRHNKEAEKRGWATLYETKRHHGVIESKGGSKGNTVTLRGKNGFYSKNMDSAELNSFYNQTYNEMKRRGLIDEGKVLQGVPADIFGQKSVSQSAMKNAVDDALLRHPEVGKWIADEYEFEVDPRFENEEEQTQPSTYTPIPFERPTEHVWDTKKPNQPNNYGFDFKGKNMSGVTI